MTTVRKPIWKTCSCCEVLMPPERFRKWVTVCKPCESEAKTEKQRKGHQEIVRVSVPGWGSRV